MSLFMDFRHGLRILRRRPLLTLVAAGSLALAIGVGTALFSVADARVLRPLEVAEPDRQTFAAAALALDRGLGARGAGAAAHAAAVSGQRTRIAQNR